MAGMAAADRVALLTEIVADGGFTLRCPTALSESERQPSVAAYVDLDASGDCSGPDQGIRVARDEWREDTVIELDRAGWYAVDLDVLFGPPYSGGRFCTYFADFDQQ